MIISVAPTLAQRIATTPTASPRKIAPTGQRRIATIPARGGA